ncbi:MAG TPA: hypothetical protein VEI01_18030 [Terriglobales bacterium]|nr:hypothetical protein [Terriglobales bacterium]
MRNMMQRYPLTINKFLDHAAKWQSTRQVVCASPEVGSSRITYAELQERSLFFWTPMLFTRV